MTKIEYDSDAERQEADDLCQGDVACYYDLFVTKDKDFAANSKIVNDKNIDTEADISK